MTVPALDQAWNEELERLYGPYSEAKHWRKPWGSGEVPEWFVAKVYGFTA